MAWTLNPPPTHALIGKMWQEKHSQLYTADNLEYYTLFHLFYTYDIQFAVYSAQSTEATPAQVMAFQIRTMADKQISKSANVTLLEQNWQLYVVYINSYVHKYDIIYMFLNSKTFIYFLRQQASWMFW